MSIVSDIEKLNSLRESGKLSQAEFDRAKEVLLSEDRATPSSADAPAMDALTEASGRSEKEKKHLLSAILSTIAAALSIVSAIIAPSFLPILAASLFVLGSALSWISYANLKMPGGE